MKKIFSLFAAVLFAGSMMAEPIVVNATDVEGIESGTTGDFEVTVNGIGLAWSGAYYNNDNNQDIRVYASKTLTLTAESNISKVEIVGFAKKDLAMTVSAGEITAGASYTADATKSDWEDPLLVVENIDAAVLTITCNKQMRAFAIRLTFDGEVPPVVADTYTVAGNDAAIFGTSWDVTNTANDMVKAAGIYKWEKAELNLTAGTIIAFKVAKNHSWDVAYPAQNDTVTIAEAGEYTLTITFDPATEKVEAVLEGAVVSTDPTNCAEAREAALSVSADNELYNDGKEYTIEGYVTSIKTAYSDQYHNISFWMADTKEGGEVLQAYRAACETEADAPQVGDKVAVTGSLTKYGTTPEFAAGCTVVIIERAEPVTPSEFGVLGVAEAIALAAEGKLKDDDILSVKGIITKIEFKGKNFAKFGSVNIYVADATGEEGEFEFYNCYSLEADTFRTSVPEYDPENASWAQFDEVTDGNNVTVKVGDVVIAKGKYKLYNTTHELNTGCFLTDINPTGEGIEETATDAKAVKVVRNGQVYILRGDKTFNLIGAEVK